LERHRDIEAEEEEKRPESKGFLGRQNRGWRDNKLDLCEVGYEQLSEKGMK
jgi:hypothetical protein